MSDFFRDGGLVMFPTLALGFLVAASAALTAFRSIRYGPLAAVLAGVTLASGLLGTALGVINTFRFVARLGEGEALKVAATGLAESTNNLVLALVILIPSGLLAAWPALQAARG